MLTTIWLMLFIFVYSQEKCFCQVGCFTWNLHIGQLTLTCRVKTDGSPVVIFDNNGDKIAKCSLQGNDSHCQLFQEDQILAVNISTTELNVTVQRSQITDYNGQWKCQHKTAIFTTNISALKGIIYDTFVEFEIVQTPTETKYQDIALRCSSCRIPFGFNAEFLIHNRSIDSVTYDPSSSTCYHVSGKCSPQFCSCAFPGNHFTRKLRVDMSKPKLFSCDMIFVDPFTTEKFSKTSGIYLDAQGFHQMETISRIIKPGISIQDSTGKITNIDLTTVSSNKHLTTKSTATDNKVSVALIVGLSIVGAITTCLLLALICQYLYVRKLRRSLDCSNSDESDHLLGLKDILIHDKENTKESQKRWIIAGFFCQILHQELTIHMKNKMSILYKKLKNEHRVHQQDSSNFLKIVHGKHVNYQSVNDNFKKFKEDDTKYDYKIRDADNLTKVLLPCSFDIVMFNRNSALSFGELLDLFNIVDSKMPAAVKTEIWKVLKDWTEWFPNDENVWTKTKLLSLIESVRLIAGYTGNVLQEDISKLMKCRSADIFVNPDLTDFTGERGKELSLFVEQSGRSRVDCIKNKMFSLLKENNVYDKFLTKKRSEENRIYRLTKLIMEIGMTVVREYIIFAFIPEYKDNFEAFLEYNKHQLFHAWHNKKRCCQCNNDFVQNDQCSLTREQYATLFCQKKENKGLQLHPGTSFYCICNINAIKDVKLDTIDFTIALCIMMHCSSTKSSIKEKEHFIATKIMQGTKNIRDCRNSIFSMANSCEMAQEKYDAAWKETEETLCVMSAYMGDDVHNKIKKDIQSLKSDELQDEQFVLAEVLKQCTQDKKLSENQQHERSFQNMLTELESGTLCSGDDLTDKDQLKGLEWQTCKGKVVLKIKRYPIIVGNNLPIHEVLIDINAPNDWNVDEILETIRNKASSISKGGSVQIIETTLEAFNMIVAIDSNMFHENCRLQTEIDNFFWNLLESCNIDLDCEAVLNISMKLLRSKLTLISKPCPPCIVYPRKNHSGSEIARIRKIEERKLKTGKDAYFTSSGEWSNEEFIFVERNNNSLIFYNFKTKKERIFHLPERPYGMAVMEEGKVVMSFPEKQEIRILVVQNDKIIYIHFKKLRGKCYTLTKKDAETVLVAMEDDGIYSYNIKNNQLKKLGIQIQDFVPRSDGLCCRAERVLHTCRENGSLHCYDVNGVFIWKISDVLKNPSAITSDAFGNVFASDFVSSKLYHIPPNGQTHNVLLSKEDNLLHPSALHFCEKRNWLLIANRDNGFVFCYEVFYK